MGDYILGSSFVFGYAATGSLLGRLVDNVSDKLIRESGFEIDGVAAALQLIGGVVLFGEVQRMLIADRDSDLGRMVGLYFFLQSQPGLKRRLSTFLSDMERAVLGDSVFDRLLADHAQPNPRHSEQAPSH